MRGLETIIGSRAFTAVKCNDLLVPANSLGNYLRSFTEPALFHTEGMGEFHLTKSGSLFKFKYKERYFVLTTKHQVTGKNCAYSYEQVCLMDYSANSLVSSSMVVFPEESSTEGQAYDCLLFEYTTSVTEGKLTPHGWYKLSEIERQYPTPAPILACAIGYPSYRNEINYETKHFGVSPNIVWGQETNFGMEGRLAFKPLNEVLFDPSGMSGGPVFGCKLVEEKLVMFFAGVLTNATKRKFNFMPVNRLSGLLNHS